MMRFIIFCFASLWVIDIHAQTDSVNPAKTTGKWFTGKEIIFTYSMPDSSSFVPEQKDGKKWVFMYTYQAAEHPQRTDDEYYESFGFQKIPTNKTSFVLKGDQLAIAKAYFQRSCFCADRGYYSVSEGTIKGQKINSQTWLITVDVMIDPHTDIAGRKQEVKKIKTKFILKKK